MHRRLPEPGEPGRARTFGDLERGESQAPRQDTLNLMTEALGLSAQVCALLDANVGGPDFERVKLTARLHMIAEWQFLGASFALDIRANAVAPKL